MLHRRFREKASVALLVRWFAGLNFWQGGRRTRQLRLCETLALGEKRFVAVVQFERQRFLIGGTSTGVALLSELPAAQQAEARFSGIDDKAAQ
ncbi:MAG TPA: flagellar biosynthetic protein FliO [Terriglobales bacterium]|jgi:flagellar biogenesis protein FliO